MKQPISVFDIKPGMRVFDTLTHKYGRVTAVRETSYEWIEPFLKWDDSDKEEKFGLENINIKFVSE